MMIYYCKKCDRKVGMNLVSIEEDISKEKQLALRLSERLEYRTCMSCMFAHSLKGVGMAAREFTEKTNKVVATFEVTGQQFKEAFSKMSRSKYSPPPEWFDDVCGDEEC